MSDPVDVLLKLALRTVVFLNEQRQMHTGLNTALIEAKEAQLNMIREKLADRGVQLEETGSEEALKDCLKRRQAAPGEHDGPSRAVAALRRPSAHEAKDLDREGADPWLPRIGAARWRETHGHGAIAPAGSSAAAASSATRAGLAAPRLTAEEDATRRRETAQRGEASGAGSRASCLKRAARSCSRSSL